MKIANAPCSWGILEFGLEGETQQYQTVLDEMAETGYEGTELGDWGFMPTDPNILSNELNCRNLDMVGAFVPINFKVKADHEPGLQTTLKIASFLSKINPSEAKIVLADNNGTDKVRTNNAGRITPEKSLTKNEWAIFAEGVNTVAEQVFNETGIESVFHHHCGGFIETPDEIEQLLERTNSDYLGLCFDTGHYAFGGGNPAEGVKTFSERIKHVHFKDWDERLAEKSVKEKWNYFESVSNGIFCELGKGSVNFEAVLHQLKKSYNNWIVVEQDILPGMGSPKTSAKRNREFLVSIGL